MCCGQCAGMHPGRPVNFKTNWQSSATFRNIQPAGRTMALYTAPSSHRTMLTTSFVGIGVAESFFWRLYGNIESGADAKRRPRGAGDPFNLERLRFLRRRRHAVLCLAGSAMNRSPMS